MLFRRNGHSLVVHAPAKLNLFLEVLEKRSDGYHELETLMVSIGIYDTLAFTPDPSGKIRFRCFHAGRRFVTARRLATARRLTTARRLATGHPSEANASRQEIPGGCENVVVQAANLLRRHAGVKQGVRINLRKRIPAAAGLAGGSSDAAATLAALNKMWNLKLSAAELCQLAAQLGSDVSFFVTAAPAAICRGRGEIVEPFLIPLGLHFVVVRPAAGLSTAAVYRHCRPASRPKRVNCLAESLRAGRLRSAARCLHNALLVPAEQLSEDVRRLRTRFSSLSVLGHQMSGSGTAYFGVCAHRRQALSLAARLRAERLGSVFVAQCRP